MNLLRPIRLADHYWKNYGFRKGFGGYAICLRDLQPTYGALHNEVYESCNSNAGDA